MRFDVSAEYFYSRADLYLFFSWGNLAEHFEISYRDFIIKPKFVKS